MSPTAKVAPGHETRARSSIRGDTSVSVAADIESVRQALGMGQIDILAEGYDAPAAIAYAAAHPDRVGRLVLDGPQVPGGPDPFGVQALAASRRGLRRLCSHRACRRTGAAPDRDLAVLAARARAGRLAGPLVGTDGVARRVRFGAADLFGFISQPAGDSLGGVTIPGLLRSARTGDPAPLIRALNRSRSPDWEPFLGLDLPRAAFALLGCDTLKVPWAAGSGLAQRTLALRRALAATPKAAFAPFGATLVSSRASARLCLGWPAGPVAVPDAAGVRSPALVIAGTDDAHAPFGASSRLAARLPAGSLLPIVGGRRAPVGSGDACALAAAAAFLRRGGTRRHCPSVGGTPAPPPPRSLAAVRPVAGLPGRRGRTVVATLLAVIDALPSIVSAPDPFSGAPVAALRSGRYLVSQRRWRFDRVEYVPGVVVDGAVFTGEDTPDPRFRVTGPAAAQGSIRIGDQAISGVLSGRRFRLTQEAIGQAIAPWVASEFAPVDPGGSKLADPPGGQRRRLGGTRHQFAALLAAARQAAGAAP